MSQIKIAAILSYSSLLLSNISVLLYTPFMLQKLGQSEYGLYSLVFSIVSSLILLDCGLAPTLVRYIIRYRVEQNDNKIPHLIAFFLIVYISIGLVCFLLGSVLYLNIDILFERTMTSDEIAKAKIMCLIITIYIALNFPFSIFSSIIVAHERFVYLKLIQIFRIIATPILMIILLFLGYKAIALAIVLVTVGVCVWIVNLIYCHYVLKVRVNIRKIDISAYREIISFSSLVFCKVLLDRFFWSGGQFILGMVSGTTLVAIFSIAMQLKGYYYTFANAINEMFLPKVTYLVFTESRIMMTELFVKVARIQMHVLGFILSAYLLFGRDFVLLWAGEEYEISYYMSLIVMIPYTIPLTQVIGKTALEALNIQKYHVYMLLIMLSLTLILSFYLTEECVYFGMPISLSVGLFIGEILMMNYFYKTKAHLDITKYWIEILKISFTISCPFLIFYFFFRSESVLYLDLFINISKYGFIYLLFLPILLNKYEKNLLLSIINRITHKFHV
jgi:O-antigen/teichoic acid export membrane protein